MLTQVPRPVASALSRAKFRSRASILAAARERPAAVPETETTAVTDRIPTSEMTAIISINVKPRRLGAERVVTAA